MSANKNALVALLRPAKPVGMLSMMVRCRTFGREMNGLSVVPNEVRHLIGARHAPRRTGHAAADESSPVLFGITQRRERREGGGPGGAAEAGATNRREWRQIEGKLTCTTRASGLLLASGPPPPAYLPACLP